MNKRTKQKLGAIVVGLIFASSSIAFIVSQAFSSPSPDNNVHKKAELGIIIYGQRMDLQPYMYSNKYIHLEEDGMLHVYARNLTIGDFFSWSGLFFNGSCIKDYCSNENISLDMYVNGQRNKQYQNYVVKNKDRIVIQYGTEEGLGDNVVSIRYGGFEPAVLNISTGAEVIWINKDSMPHGLVSEMFDSPVIGPGQRFNYLFEDNGSVVYNDTVNDFQGRINVG